MKERLVDVKAGERGVVHTFPVTLSDPAIEPDEEAFMAKAREAAAHGKVVANTELHTLSAEMHRGRGAPLEPSHDPLGALAETKVGLDQFVRERAYFLWEQAGRPDGSGEQFWLQAQHERWCDRAYALWEREGCLAGKAEEYWNRVCDFEKT